MAEVVKQVNVLSTAIKVVAAEFNIPVYSDEVLKKFSKPCFFVAASSHMNPYTDNVVEKELTIALTYFAKKGEKNEITYLDVVDRIQQIFQSGIQVNDRYLHVESVDDDRVGEERDVLQVTIVIPFLEQVVKPASTAETMEEVDMRIDTTSNDSQLDIEDETWNGIITSETV